MMQYTGVDSRALRLILSALDRNEAAFATTIVELPNCPHCLVGLVEDLAVIAAEWIEAGHTVEDRNPDRCLDRAIGHVEVHLRGLLDQEAAQ
jgi:hypothetical protein